MPQRACYHSDRRSLLYQAVAASAGPLLAISHPCSDDAYMTTIVGNSPVIVSAVDCSMTRTLVSRLRALGGSRGEFIMKAVPSGASSILDIGCGPGWTVGSLLCPGREVHGVDVDPEAIADAQRAYPNATFRLQTATSLPYEDRRFDVVLLSEVIEHVGDTNKQSVISEAHRVLKDGGMLIFTAPYQGAFAWADPLDFKRRVPSLYRIYMRLTGYRPQTPIDIGHKHLDMQEIGHLLRGRFRIDALQHCGIIDPILHWFIIGGARTKLLPTGAEKRLDRFQAWQSGIRCPSAIAYAVRIVAHKPVRPTDHSLDRPVSPGTRSRRDPARRVGRMARIDHNRGQQCHGRDARYLCCQKAGACRVLGCLARPLGALHVATADFAGRGLASAIASR